MQIRDYRTTYELDSPPLFGSTPSRDWTVAGRLTFPQGRRADSLESLSKEGALPPGLAGDRYTEWRCRSTGLDVKHLIQGPGMDDTEGFRMRLGVIRVAITTSEVAMAVAVPLSHHLDAAKLARWPT